MTTITNDAFDALGMVDDVRRRMLIGRFGGLTGLALFVLLSILAVVSDGTRTDRVGTGACALFALSAGLLLTLAPARVPVWAMDGMAFFTAGLLVVMAHVSPTIRPALPGIYVIFGTTLFAMRSWRTALSHIAVIGTSYGTVLATGPAVYAPLTRWVTVMAALTTFGLFLRWLISTVAGIAQAEHLAWREAEQATAELEATGRAKSEFLARMSHELRTPLNAVLGFSELLREQLVGPLNQQQHDYVGDIAESARHLVSLVDDALDPDKVAQGEIELLMETVDVPTALDEATRMVREAAVAGGITLRLDLPQFIEPIYVDRRKFRQVVVNLLVNAVKFTPPGGRVILSAHQRDGTLVVAVGDTGIGIAAADLDRIFEEYARSSPAVEGTGLGLPLARRFIELHGGRLSVRSTPGAGSTFTVELPYRVPPDNHVEEPPVDSVIDDHAAFTQPGSEANRLLVARMGSWFASLAAGVLLLVAFVTPVDLRARAILIGLAVTAQALAVCTRRWAALLPAPSVDLVGFFGIFAITAGVAVSGQLSDVVPLAFGCVTMTTFALWPWRRALVQVVTIIACYTTVIVVRPGPHSVAEHLSVLNVVLATGVMSSVLLTRLRRLVVAEQSARVHAEEVRARLDSASRHKSAFLANMSHELRTPLNAVIGFADLLVSRSPGPLTTQQVEYLYDIQTSARHLLALINDILDLARIEAGRLQIDRDVVAVAAVLEHAAAVVSSTAAARDISIGVEVDDDAQFVLGDQQRLVQVMVNLVSNAVKFTPDAGRVDLTATLDGNDLVIAVRDTGIGILPEQRQSIFESFRQGPQRDTGRVPEGAGVGLSLVDGLVALHGGRIDVDSQPDRGSTFVVTLPGALVTASVEQDGS